MANGIDLGSAYGRIELDGSQALDTVNSLSDTMRSAGTAMSLGVTAPLVGIAATAIDSAADFEQSLNIMQQVSGATADQMAQLQQQALDLGASTAFSAGEAAEAQLELAKAGMKPLEVYAAMPGVLDMAAAGGMGVAQAAEIAANAVNTFGLEASSTTDIANMLAAAANASSVDITDLAAGMTMAGSVFASAGQSIDDLNIAMALLGNNGIKGSDAGTSLKTALMRLTAPTDEAAEALSNLGVSVFDSQGNMREFPDILADLQQGLYGTNAVTVTSSNLTAEQAERMDYLKKTIAKTQTQLANYQSGIAGVAQSEADKIVAQDRLNRTLQAAQAEYAQLASIGGTTSTVMKQLTEEERQQALATIFGADAIRSISVLMSEGTDGWNEMADALGVAGAATATANARMKGMRGAIEYLKGSIDSFLIGTALPYLDALGNFVRMGADALTAFAALPRPAMDAAVAFGAVLAAAGPLMLAISGITAAIGFLLSPVGLLVAGVAALAAGFVLWQQNFMGIQQRAAQFAVTLKDMAESATGIDFDAVADGLRSLGSYLGAVAEDGDYLNDWLTHLPEPIQPAVQALGQLVAAFTGLAQTGDFGAFIASIQAIDWGGLLDDAAAGLNSLKDGMVAALQGIDWAGALETAGGWLDSLKSGVVAAIQGIPWGEALSAAGNVFMLLAGWVTAKLREIPWDTALETAAGWLDALKDGVVGAIQGIPWGTALSAAGSFLDTLKTGVIGAVTSIDWGAALAAAGSFLDSLKNGVVGAVTAIPWGTALTAAGDWLADLKNSVVAALQGIDWGGALTDAGDWLANLWGGVATALGGIPWASMFTQAGEWLGGLTQGVVNRIKTINWGAKLAEAGDYLSGLWGNVAAALGNIKWGEALAAAGEWLTNLSTQVVSAIQNYDWGGALTAGGWLEGLTSGVVSAITSIDWGGALTAAGDWLANLWGGVVDAVTSIPWLTHLATAGEFLGGLAQGVVNRIRTINWGAKLLEAGDYLAGLWGNVVGAIQKIDWGAALATAATWLTNLSSQVVTAIQGIDWGGALTAAGAVFGGLETAVTGALTGLGFAGAATALDGVKTALEGLPTAVTSAKSSFAGLLEQVTPIVTQVKDFFAPAIERLQAAFTALPENLAPLLPKLQELGSAFGGLMQALAPFVALVGVVLAIAVEFGINSLTAAFEALPDTLGPIIEQITATIKLITTILTETVTAVKAVIDGDWTTVWESAKTIAGGFNEFFRGLFARLGTFMGAVAKRISDPIIQTLKTLGVDVQKPMEDVRKTFEDIWAKVLTYIQPVIDLVSGVQTAIEEFSAWLGTVTLPNPFQPLVDAYNFVASHLPGAQPAASAGGTSYFGGGATAINERGYEQVILPAGSRVLTNGQTNNLPNQEPTIVNINLGGVTVSSDMDGRRLGNLIRDQLVMLGV